MGNLRDIPLTALRSEPKRSRIVTWDIETTKDGMEPFLVGVRWGYDWCAQFEGPECIAKFVAWILEDSEANKDTAYFAHNGGGFDHLFAIYEMVERQKGRFRVGPVLSGGSAIMVSVLEKSTGRQFTLFDSLRLLNMSLKKIGATLGKYGKQDFDLDTPTNDPRWREYNNQDTLVLFDALTKMQDAIASLGGEMRPTAASTAMDLFRRKYLKHPIWPQHEHHEFYRECYYGGRTEIFDMNRRENVKLYDINSLYPYACTFPLPVSPETTDFAECILGEKHTGYFVECLVRVPDDCHIPPLPKRIDGKLIFPVGQFWGSWASPDLQNLLLAGGQILKVKRAHRYRLAPIARDMMLDLYAARLDKERPEMGLGAKLIMNAWYGKTGQREDRDKMLFCPQGEDLKNLGEGWEWECRDPEYDLWISHFLKREVHILPQVASYVTAIARSIHYPYLLKSSDPIYCDTDCEVTSDDLPTGTELGAMKLEANFEWFQAYLPKLYHGKIVGENTVKDRAKGFGGWNKEKYEDGIVAHLTRGSSTDKNGKTSPGGKVNVRGPTKLLTLLRGGSLKPREKSNFKKIRSIYDKRIVLSDGSTKPHRIWED